VQVGRSFLALLAVLAVAASVSPAGAEDYPSRPTTIVVPFTPGGTTTSSPAWSGSSSSALGQVLRSREQAWRRQPRCGELRREGGARWLHAVHGHQHDHAINATLYKNCPTIRS